MKETFMKLLTSEHMLGFAVILLTVVLGLIVRSIFRGLMKRVLDRGEKAKTTFLRITQDAIYVVLIILAFIQILQINGINVSSLITSLGIVSVIVGLALQDPLRDIVMGLHILLDRFYAVGDVIQYRENIGQVVTMNLQTTRVRDLETGTLITICNRNIDEIAILGKAQDIDVPLSYDEDPRRIHTVLNNVAKELASREEFSDCRYLGTENFGDSSIAYRLRIFSAPAEHFNARRTALNAIQSALEEEGITIPFNQLDVHIDGSVK